MTLIVFGVLGAAVIAAAIIAIVALLIRDR
jgi:hypothetical protein